MSKKKDKKWTVEEGMPVLINWFDAWWDGSTDGKASDINDVVLTLKDIGFFVKRLNGYVVIAQEMGKDKNFRHIHYIPEVNIIDILLLGL